MRGFYFNKGDSFSSELGLSKDGLRLLAKQGNLEIMQQHMHLMLLQKLQRFIQSHHHLLWRKLQTNGQHREERIFSDRLYR